MNAMAGMACCVLMAKWLEAFIPDNVCAQARVATTCMHAFVCKRLSLLAVPQMSFSTTANSVFDRLGPVLGLSFLGACQQACPGAVSEGTMRQQLVGSIVL